MKLDYIEIGTADFDTIVQSSDLTGFSIDPLKIYLDRLPNKIGNTKVNVAISDFDGECNVFYISPEDIEKFNLPGWVKGCNSIIEPHPSVIKILRENDLLSIYKTETVNVMTWDTLIRKNNIIGVNYLKIDTEGHDCTIIKSILNSDTNILPKKIKFETNILTSHDMVKETITALCQRGYTILETGDENTVVILNENVIEKVIFSVDSNPEYMDFWEVNSKVCSKKLKITPVLFYICDEDSDFYWDTYGLVKKVKSVSSSNTGFESQIFRMYGTRYFLKDVCLTNDIDMLIFNMDFIKKSKIDRESITIFGSDAYDISRPECVGIYSGPDRYPICYIAGTGETFHKVLNTDVPFEEYHERLLSLGLKWDTDEIYFGRMVNKTSVPVNKVKREYSSKFHLPTRIEKHNFFEKGSFKLNLNGYVNIEQYIDCHCARPYSEYKTEIDNLVNIVLSKP